MSIKKHIQLTATSTISWKDAIVQAVAEVSKTINNLETLTVLEQKANINEDRIVEYFVLLDIVFSIDENIRNEKVNSNE